MKRCFVWLALLSQAATAQSVKPDPALDKVEWTATGAQVVVRNRSDVHAGPSILQVLVNGRKQATVEVPALESKATRTIPVSWPAQPGPHTVELVLQSEDDADRENNVMQMQRAAALEGPKLATATLQVQDSEPRLGLPLHITFSVRNSGDTPAYKLPVTLWMDGERVANKVFYETIAPKQSQEFNWKFVPREAGRRRLALTMDSKPPAKSAPGQVWVTIAERPGYVLTLEVPQAPNNATVGVPQDILVNVKNVGDLEAGDVTVALLADGKRQVWQLPATLKAKGEGQLILRWTPAKAGPAHLELEAQASGVAGKQYPAQARLTVQVQ